MVHVHFAHACTPKKCDIDHTFTLTQSPVKCFVNDNGLRL